MEYNIRVCADKIVVLQKGRICGSGTHEELFNNNDIYRRLLLNQINEEIKI